MLILYFVFFFFFKQKTAYEMRISDWSSDVCSSDLLIACSFGARRIRSARMTTTDPFALFDAWFAEARASEPNDSNAMALATATPDGRPSVRMVLLKGHGPDGFVFYTNLDSRKGGELAANPQVALLLDRKSTRPNSSH